MSENKKLNKMFSFRLSEKKQKKVRILAINKGMNLQEVMEYIIDSYFSNNKKTDKDQI